MTIRPANLDDLDAIMALERASFPTDAWSAGMMHDELASPHGRYFVLEDAGAVVGYGGVRALAGAADADIQTIAIGEAFRGRGAGRMLLVTLLDEAAARGAREVFLEVRADNPVAQNLYAKTGFEELGRRPRYYQPDDVDAIVMRLDLARWMRDVRDPRSSENRADFGRMTPDAPNSAGSSENNDMKDAARDR